MWFHTWSDLVRVLLVGAAAYVTLLVVLRVSGKRTLAKMNAFDFVVTVAFGSVLATTLLSSTVSWSDGVVALAVLAALQYALARITSWFPAARQIVTASPTLLLHQGELQRDAMRRQRVAEGEVLQAIRAAGSGDVKEVAAVVLETDGTFSVVTAAKLGDGSALAELWAG